MVHLEEKFVDLAMELGDVPGMNVTDIKNYVRYIADWRLTQLKLPTLYGYFEMNNGSYQQRKGHPLPWLTSILNGVEHANFFEQRATEYAKTVTQGQWEGDQGVWTHFDAWNIKDRSSLSY